MKKIITVLTIAVYLTPLTTQALTYDEVVKSQIGGEVLGTITAATSYDAVTDTGIKPLPPLPALGPAGSSFIDPTFGTRIYRVTDANTNPGYSNDRCHTTSGNEINMFNADNSVFYVICGSLLFFRFNPITKVFNPIMDPKNPSQPIRLSISAEPDFSLTDPNIIYLSSSDKIEKYDLSSYTKSTVLDLKTLVPTLTGYSNNISNSMDGKLDIVFNGPAGGPGIDVQRNIAIYNTNTGTSTLIDTIDGTIDGQPFNIPFSFGIHASKIDKSGRYISITTGVIYNTNKPASNVIIVDLQTRQAQWLTYVSDGHRALGYGQLANGSVQNNDYGPNILLRSLDLSTLNNPASVTSLMPGPNPPPWVGGASYVSWNNAQLGINVPVIGVFYNTTSTTARFNGEIVAAATDGSKTVWRFVHNRSIDNYRVDNDFWSLPRGAVSQDGRFMLFMSNWERTLGNVKDGYRSDVFLFELKRESIIAPPTDTIPPVISVIAPTPNTTSATISWSTNEAGDSQVEFGTDLSSLTSASGLTDTGAGMKTTHSVMLSNLTPGATYYYRVKSRDSAGNLGVSATNSFTLSLTSGQSASSNNLVGYWKFDEGSGSSAQDFSGNNNHGTVANTAWDAAGKFGKDLVFNGSNGSVDVGIGAGSLDTLGNTFTISAWIKPASLTRATIFSTGDWSGQGVIFGINGGGLEVYYPSQFIAATPVNVVLANQWQHVVYTRSGTGAGTHSFYVNGVKQSLSLDDSHNFVDTSYKKYIGSRGLVSAFFNGSIDEVKVYNRALSGAEVLAEYNTVPSSIQRKLILDPEGLSTNKTATGTIQFLNTSTKIIVNTLPFTTNTQGEYTFSTPANLPSSVGLRIVVPGYLPRLVSNADLTTNSLITIPIPQLYSGDFNGDGIINSLDYSGLNQKWNQTTNITLQDINRDGKVDSLDFTIMRNNWYRRGE